MHVMSIDPRAGSPDKLPAPDPLPHVSRRALGRVKDRLEAPTCCPMCESSVHLVSNAEIYGREYGAWPYVYLCSGCGAYVGLHPSTDLPLGTLADKPTRTARSRAKGLFIRITEKRFKGDRSAAYSWLAGRMKIPADECHFGMMDLSRAEHAENVLRDDRHFGEVRS